MTEIAGEAGPTRPRDRPRHASLHSRPPVTMSELQARARWIVPASAGLFALLAVLVRLDAVPWDQPIVNWVVDHRTPWLNDLARSITRLGGEDVVYVVALLCAFAALPRCRPLALAIVILALTRTLIVASVKEVVARDRPPAVIALMRSDGFSFPSGHPFAVAASWGFIPLVLALYTHRRWLFWTSVVVVWSTVLLVGASRTYLGVHYPSDVVGSVLLALVFVAGAELLIGLLHRHQAPSILRCGVAPANPRNDSNAGGDCFHDGAPGVKAGAERQSAKRLRRADSTTN